MAKKKNAVGIVLPVRLNVRSEPNGAILDTVAQNTKLSIVSKKKGWYNVSGCVSGWVDGQFLALKEVDDA